MIQALLQYSDDRMCETYIFESVMKNDGVFIYAQITCHHCHLTTEYWQVHTL